jgi:hypothetical protein
LRISDPPTSETVPSQGAKGGLWWIGQIVLLLLALFFVGFGVHVLILAYHLNDPSEFILTFFASNLIIMISIVIVIGLVLRMKRSLTPGKQDTPHAR